MNPCFEGGKGTQPPAGSRIYPSNNYNSLHAFCFQELSSSSSSPFSVLLLLVPLFPPLPRPNTVEAHERECFNVGNIGDEESKYFAKTEKFLFSFQMTTGVHARLQSAGRRRCSVLADVFVDFSVNNYSNDKERRG